MIAYQTTEGDRMHYRFNVTFTRPDENDANIYTVGYNTYGSTVTDLASAERWTREAFAHLTILSIELIAIDKL